MQNLFRSWSLTAVVFLSACASAAPATQAEAGALESRSCGIPSPVTVLTTFPFPSWCENLAVRSNGQILTSRLDAPMVWQVDPTGKNAPVEVASWNASEWSGCLGISETTNDVFYVILAAFFDQATFVKTSGVNSIFKIDMSTFSLTSSGALKTPATVTHLVDIPDADFLNGMTTLNEDVILVGDIYNGWVYAVNVCTGTYTIAVNDPKMKFTYVSDPPTNLGVNGIKMFNNYLYFDNTAAGFLARIFVNPITGTAIGSSSIVATNLPRADDFIIRSDGTIFVAQNQEDELSIVYPGTSVGEVIAGSNISTTLAGVTAGKFGRLSTDKNRLYLSTSGGEFSHIQLLSVPAAVLFTCFRSLPPSLLKC